MSSVILFVFVRVWNLASDTERRKWAKKFENGLLKEFYGVVMKEV